MAKAGTRANIPVGTPHFYDHERDRPTKTLIFLAPAGREPKLAEVGAPLAEGTTTALPPTKEESE